MVNEASTVLKYMEAYGGRFAKSLADCYECASRQSKMRLESVFSDYFKFYDEMATTKKVPGKKFVRAKKQYKKMKGRG